MNIPHQLTSDFLPNGSTVWEKGPNIPEPGFQVGSAVVISDTEVVLTGGIGCGGKRIMKYNTITNEWQNLKDLRVARRFHSAIFFNGKIILTGGYRYVPGDWKTVPSTVLDLTEIYDIEKECSEMAGNLNIKRQDHGIGIIKKNGKSTVIAYGGISSDGESLSSIEEWNDKEKKWVVSQLTTKEPKHTFGFCS